MRLSDLTYRQQKMLAAAVDEGGISPETYPTHSQSGKALEKLGLVRFRLGSRWEDRRWLPTELGKKVRRTP